MAQAFEVTICRTKDSDNNGVWTDYKDYCEDYEER